MGNSAESRRGAGDGARAKIQHALKICSIFDRVSKSARETLAAAALFEVVPGSVVVIEQGAADALVVLGRGRARIERTILDGRPIPLGYRGAGDVLGEGCVGHAKVYTESATTMEEAEIVKIPLSALREIMASDPALGPAVLALLIHRQRDVEDRIESMLFRNVQGRLAEFLLKAAERWGVPMPKGTLISAPITHMEIAEVIGSTRETVTLTLGALRRDGLVDVAGRRLIVRDREALAARC